MGEVQLEWRAVEADLLNTEHNGCYKHLMADGDGASPTVTSYYHSIVVLQLLSQSNSQVVIYITGVD